MEFAKKQLEKYGWKEGQGLGKNEDGISKALKPKLKFDNAGLGHDISQEFVNPWWQVLYNEAASNIITNEEGNQIILKTKYAEEDTANLKKKRTKCDSKHHKKYKGFIRTSKLKGAIENNIISDGVLENENNGKRETSEVPEITNEELFKICDGRTAHKGARHGLKMSGKLARVVEQERQLMKHFKKDISDVNNANEPMLKKKKSK